MQTNNRTVLQQFVVYTAISSRYSLFFVFVDAVIL